jgi:hypothetical protein
MQTVSLDQLQNAMEWASSDFMDSEAYICRQIGRIYWIAGDPGMIDGITRTGTFAGRAVIQVRLHKTHWSV